MTESVSLSDRIRATIRRYAMIEADRSILVGVSGGADSVCLLRVLQDLSEPLGLTLGVAHFNHGWRGEESSDDERFVAALAAALDLPLYVDRVAPSTQSSRSEEGARDQRWLFLTDVTRRHGFHRIAVAHTRDDRTETFLLNLMRGTGTEGLVAMRPVSENIIRPLIETTRTDVESYLKELGQEWRADSTNHDLRFARNKVRHQALPQLASDFNPRLSESLSRTIQILEDEDVWMEQSVSEWLRTRYRFEGADLVVQISDLESQPCAFVRRILRSSLRLAGSALVDIGFDDIERVRSLLVPGKSGRAIQLPGTITVERNFDSLSFFPDSSPPADYEYELSIPGRVEVHQTGQVFEARLVAPDAVNTVKPNSHRVFVDGESLGRYVKIRNWKSGDFYDPDGGSSSKLTTLFQKQRIPRRVRRQWPVLVADSSIIWVASFPVSRDFVPTGKSQRVVEFEASHIG
jgi:tRNA(Ile)-lysidine synthase